MPPHKPPGAPRTAAQRRNATGSAALVAAAIIGVCTLLHLSAAAFLPPASGTATGRRTSAIARAAEGEPKDAEVVGLGPANPSPVEGEVVSETGSRPQKLLYSEGVQRLLGVLTRLKDTTSGGKTGLALLLNNLVGAFGKIADSEVPESLEADFEEALERSAEFTDAAIGGPEDDWRGPLREFSKLRISRRLDEVVDELLPWDEVYPGSLASTSKIDQMEVRQALRAFFRAVDLQEVATWTEAEFSEAGDLVQRSEVLKEVSVVVEKVVEESWQNLLGTATAVAAGVALLPFVVTTLIVAACCACLNPGGGGDLPPSVPTGTEFQMLPLYKLGTGGS